MTEPLRRCWNRHTGRAQTPLPLGACGFESHPPHSIYRGPMPRTDPPTTLRPMTAAEWVAWAEHIDRGYVEQMVEMGGMSRRAAEAKAAADWARLLPDGPLTAGHTYFVAESGGRRVATLWLGELDDELDGALVWVFDIEVDADVRGRGYGRAVMVLAEQEVGAVGRSRIGLNVFARNVTAIALYTSLGYRVARRTETGQNMLKDLENGP